MIAQHMLLNDVADLIDKGVLRTTLDQTFGTINAANLKRAHALLESGKSRGKIVLEGWWRGLEGWAKAHLRRAHHRSRTVCRDKWARFALPTLRSPPALRRLVIHTCERTAGTTVLNNRSSILNRRANPLEALGEATNFALKCLDRV